jgi:orotate phosphoribosyltransferase
MNFASRTAYWLLNTQCVLFNADQPFKLTSGRYSPVYVDIRRLIGFVEARSEIMDMATNLLIEEVGEDQIDFIAGGETAGIPYAAFMAERLHKPMLYVRKQPKGFGRMAQIEGFLPEQGSRKTILIEDLQTDGGSKKVFVDALRNAGAQVDHAFVVFHYGIFPKSLENMKALGIQLHALCTWRDILAQAHALKSFDAATLQEVESFLNAPEIWQDHAAQRLQAAGGT